nr:MAG TPA: hypothetical protein [Caudoviricetes sp.]
MCLPVCLSAIEDNRDRVPPPRPGARSQCTHYHSRFLLFFFGLSLLQHKLTVKTCVEAL